jgi:bifunctional non-homologous end joining protein LigD
VDILQWADHFGPSLSWFRLTTRPSPDRSVLRSAPRFSESQVAKLLKGSHLSIVLNEHFEEEGASVYRAACQLGFEGIVSKRLGSIYRRGRSPHWVKVRNPKAPAVKREAEEDWGR